jgi:hypothetical protein
MSATAPPSGRRRALLVGVGRYEDERLARLPSPADVDSLARVLADPAIGDFATRVVDTPDGRLLPSMEEFFLDGAPDDLLLLYFGGHGIVDASGELHFATSTTRLEELASTSVPAAFLRALLDRGPSRQVVVLLDVSYGRSSLSGVSVKGQSEMPKARDEAPADLHLDGRGRVILSASDAIQYAFDADGVTDLREGSPSLFTSAIVDGLASGDADRDLDGFVSVDELYDYVYERMRERSDRIPQKSSSASGIVWIARNPRVMAAESSEPGAEPSAQPPADGRYDADPVATSDLWTTGDQLGYRDYAEAIAAFIQHGETRPPLTIGIKAPWGAGKTSLMRMVQDELDPLLGARRAPIRLTSQSRKLLGRRRRRRERDDDPDLERVTVRTVLKELDDRDATERDQVRAAPPKAAEVPRLLDQTDWRPTVWFNPWMYQSGEQIWAGLAHEVISQITERMPRAEREHFWLSLNLSRVDEDAVRRKVHRVLFERLVPVALALAGLVVLALVAVALDAATGFSAPLRTAVSTLFAAGGGVTVLGGVWHALRFRAEPASASLERLVREPNYAKAFSGQINFSELVPEPGYQNRLGFLYLVQTDIRRVLNLVATPKRPMIVFVDDLDRCSPSTVTQVIEAINLFLAGEFPNCIFVLAMEPEVVAAHIEVAHEPLVKMLASRGLDEGAGTLGWRFLEKIVQLPLSLPAPEPTRVSAFLGGFLASPELTTAPATTSPDTPGADADAGDDARTDTLPDGGEPPTGSTARPDEADEAARAQRQLLRKELGQRLRHDSPEVLAIARAVSGRLDGNPREIKRFVNVFRFYAFIQQEREQAGLSPRTDLMQVAKLAVLAIRWPHLRGVLGSPAKPGEEGTVLALLDASLHATDGAKEAPPLNEQLEKAGVRESVRRTLIGCDDLYAFLGEDPRLESSVMELL